jgi:four helix bundle protein
MSAGIRDLKVWVEATALAADVVRSLRGANRREIKVAVEAAMASASAVSLRIADGYARYEPAEQHRMYTAARRELTRLETHLGILRQADLLPAPAHAQLGSRIQGVHRLLAGYLIYLDRQVGGAAPRRDSPVAADRPTTPAGSPAT